MWLPGTTRNVFGIASTAVRKPTCSKTPVADFEKSYGKNVGVRPRERQAIQSINAQVATRNGGDLMGCIHMWVVTPHR
jgi:hypothetical protein